MQTSYPLLSLRRDDLKALISNGENGKTELEAKTIVARISDERMQIMAERLAEKLGSNFWICLSYVLEEEGLK